MAKTHDTAEFDVFPLHELELQRSELISRLQSLDEVIATKQIRRNVVIETALRNLFGELRISSNDDFKIIMTFIEMYRDQLDDE